MIFEKLLTPDFMFASYSEVTPEFLSSIGVRALICDIDNTLVTYDDARRPPRFTDGSATWNRRE